MSADTTLVSELSDEQLESLLEAARGTSDRRVEIRHPFFTEVTLRSIASTETEISAFSRELAVGGIGLLHAGRLKSGEIYEIDIRIEAVRVVKKGRLGWCRPVGDGWFLSGWSFV